jgi:hypothetical protein
MEVYVHFVLCICLCNQVFAWKIPLTAPWHRTGYLLFLVNFLFCHTPTRSPLVIFSLMRGYHWGALSLRAWMALRSTAPCYMEDSTVLPSNAVTSRDRLLKRTSCRLPALHSLLTTCVFFVLFSRKKEGEVFSISCVCLESRILGG